MEGKVWPAFPTQATSLFCFLVNGQEIFYFHWYRPEKTRNLVIIPGCLCVRMPHDQLLNFFSHLPPQVMMCSPSRSFIQTSLTCHSDCFLPHQWGLRFHAQHLTWARPKVHGREVLSDSVLTLWTGSANKRVAPLWSGASYALMQACPRSTWAPTLCSFTHLRWGQTPVGTAAFPPVSLSSLVILLCRIYCLLRRLERKKNM